MDCFLSLKVMHDIVCFVVLVVSLICRSVAVIFLLSWFLSGVLLLSPGPAGSRPCSTPISRPATRSRQTSSRRRASTRSTISTRTAAVRQTLSVAQIYVVLNSEMWRRHLVPRIRPKHTGASVVFLIL